MEDNQLLETFYTNLASSKMYGSVKTAQDWRSVIFLGHRLASNNTISNVSNRGRVENWKKKQVFALIYDIFLWLRVN